MVCDKNYFTYISWSQRSFILQGDNNTKSYLQDFQKSKKLKRKIKAKKKPYVIVINNVLEI